MVFNETRELNHDSLTLFRQEIRDIQQRRGKADGTLIEVDVDKLEEGERKIWNDYKSGFNELMDNFGDSSQTQNLVKKYDDLMSELRSLRGNISPAFHSWMGNRLVVFAHVEYMKRGSSKEDIDEIKAELLEEKQAVFGK